jgi:YVTN family beta-propeller protein
MPEPHYIEFSPNYQFYYMCTRENTGRVVKTRSSDNVAVDLLEKPGLTPTAIVVDAAGAFGYVCDFTPSTQLAWIYKVDLSDMEVTDSIPAGGATTHDIKISSDGELIVAANFNSDQIVLVYTDADSVRTFLLNPSDPAPLGQPVYGPYGVAIDHNDSLAYIACRHIDQIKVFDLVEREIVDSINIPVNSKSPSGTHGPTLMTVSPDNRKLYVTTQWGNSVVVVDLMTKQTLADIAFSANRPFGITMSSDGSRIYTCCVNSGQPNGWVYAINGNTDTKIDSLQVGQEPFGLIWIGF